MGNFKIFNHTQGTESGEVCSVGGCLWNKSFTVKPGDQLSLYYYKSGGTLPIGTKVHFVDNISKGELKVDSIGSGGYVNPWWSTSWAGGKYEIYAYDEYENAGTNIITLNVELVLIPPVSPTGTISITNYPTTTVEGSTIYVDIPYSFSNISSSGDWIRIRICDVDTGQELASNRELVFSSRSATISRQAVKLPSGKSIIRLKAEATPNDDINTCGDTGVFATSSIISISLTKPACTNFVLSFNRPASTTEIGQSITFSGQLSCDGIGVSGKAIEIWDTLGINEKIATATTTTTNGMFSAPWTVKDINYYPNSGKISVYAYYPETGLKSQEYAVTLSSIPPPDIRYSCNLGVCQQTVNGQYATLAECQNACKTTEPTPDKYVCVNGVCQKDNVSGTLTLEQCQSTCKVTPPPPTTKYNCINNTCTPDASGIYSVEECQNVCKPPEGCPSGYYKAADGRCKPHIRTPFGNMKEEDVLLLGMGTVGAITGFILLKEVTRK